METGQDLQIVIYSQEGVSPGQMKCTGSIARGIYRLRAGAAILAFSDSQLGQFSPISPYPDDAKLPSILHSSAEF
jgi:hypothetical protein